ncbi:hypothetical protein BUALT_Bualt10G0062600 [Buddleja alternifolia]|uniref:NAB domain-containing protein n=1 Tax=Buddleja alternifolia TaxID=168488 RepID=A0AAV6X3R5_9LAMI|nr:hypothetical protein BUALT_Bualt10G0062600 [Buddleja alternifolia]
MPKHRLRKSFKSILGSHIDPEKDEELKGTKAEIDGKVQKILKFLKEEDDNDRKEPLADLIEDFHNHYESLYARYDNLTEELRKKTQGKHGRDSSSSSSDSSDSDDSPRKKGKKNGKLKNNFENDIKQELEMALLEVGDLKRKLTATIDEKEALYQEYQSALRKAQETQRIITVVNVEAEKSNEEKSRLFCENADLNIELDVARKLQAELNQKLKDMNMERESLLVEKINAEELRTINGQLQHEQDNLRLELDAAKGELITLKEKLEISENETIKLSQLQKATEQEKSGLFSKISQLEDEIKQDENKIHELVTESSQLSEKVTEKEREIDSLSNLKHELEEQLRIKIEDLTQLEEEKSKLLSENSEMERALIEKESEISNLLKKYEDGEREASARIIALTEDVNRLQEQLNSQKSEGDIILEKKSGEILEFLIQIEKLKSEGNQLREDNGSLENNISQFEEIIIEKGNEIIALQKNLDDVQNEKSTQIAALIEQINSLQQEVELLQSEKNQLEVQIERYKQESMDSLALAEDQNNELVNKIIELERELKQQDDAFIKLHEEKNEEINQLEENIEDLKRDLEMKADEMSTVVENMRNIEVKQRLSSQKLRITEQVLGEKEETHQSKVDWLKEEQKLLKERITILSGIIATYKEAQVKIVTEISEKVNNSLTGIDSFSMKFEEDYGHLESRIYEIVSELKVTKNWINESNAEKNELKKEIASLHQQELLLMGKIGELETVLRKDEDERKSLIQMAKQREEKMGELEKMIKERDEKMGEMERTMNEKDNGMLSLSEEKREAIRQLCIWIDYHHNRYDDLKDMILKTRGGRRRHIDT